MTPFAMPTTLGCAPLNMSAPFPSPSFPNTAFTQLAGTFSWPTVVQDYGGLTQAQRRLGEELPYVEAPTPEEVDLRRDQSRSRIERLNGTDGC